MPSKEFEKYLQNIPEKNRQVINQNTQIGQEVTQTPATNSHTPHPADAGKPVAGVEDTGKPDALAKYQLRQQETIKDAGATLQQSGVAPAQDNKEQER